MRIKSIILSIALVFVFNNFCSGKIYVDYKEPGHKANADQIIKTAQKYLGIPYCFNGMTPECFDCSGLLVTVFADHDIQLPRNSEEQARCGKQISSMNELRKGDLVFFAGSYKTNKLITHSGIYIGHKKFIHVSSKKGVTITSLHDSWWTGKFIFGTRVLK